MSYYSYHELSWDSESPTENEVISRLAKLMNTTSAEAEEIALHRKFTTWYESSAHLQQLSSEHPGVLFTLDRQGEDDERHVDFFRDGRFHTKPYEPPPFDEEEFLAEALPPREES